MPPTRSTGTVAPLVLVLAACSGTGTSLVTATAVAIATIVATATAAATAAILWPAPTNQMALTVAAGLEPERVARLAHHVHVHLDVFVLGE